MKQPAVNAPKITIKNAHLAYQGKCLFDDLNLTIQAGKLTCILGPSGVGKSTLLRMIAGLNAEDTVFRGEISADNSLPLASQIAYMAQEDLLLPWLTVLENTLLGFKLRGQITSEAHSHAEALLAKVGLQNALDKLPAQLSGGMRQRVALVRTFLQAKPIVIMDEPFAALDAITKYELQSLSAELLKDKTVLLVTHDPVEALRLADEIYILSGKPAKLYSPIELNSATPRDPRDAVVIEYQAELFRALIAAKEMSL